MSQKLKLTKMMLTTRDGKEIALSIDEARDLYGQLAELFAPRLPIQAPIIIERDRWPAPWNPCSPHWLSSPGSADYPAQVPYISCLAPSGLQTRYMGEAVDS